MEGRHPISSWWCPPPFLRFDLLTPWLKLEIFHNIPITMPNCPVNLPGGELRRRGAEDELSMRKYLQVFIRCSSQTDGYFLWTGRRPDLSRGSKHLSRWVVEYAHKKSQVWQAWPRLLSKVASFIHEMMKKNHPSLSIMSNQYPFNVHILIS